MSINFVLLLILVSGVALTFVWGNLWWKSASIELGARHNVSLLFRFNASGMIDSFRADARARTDASRTIHLPWEGRFWNYALQDGLQVPLEGEVAWIHPDGAKPYWRGKMTRFKYEFAQ